MAGRSTVLCLALCLALATLSYVNTCKDEHHNHHEHEHGEGVQPTAIEHGTIFTSQPLRRLRYAVDEDAEDHLNAGDDEVSANAARLSQVCVRNAPDCRCSNWVARCSQCRSSELWIRKGSSGAWPLVGPAHPMQACTHEDLRKLC